MNLARFETLGREAYESGAFQTAAPTAHPEVRAAIEGLPVGGGAVPIMRAYNRGWDAAADDAALAVVLGDMSEAQLRRERVAAEFVGDSRRADTVTAELLRRLPVAADGLPV